jgi:alginate O-acetyltransferase complex protein AlgI
LTPTGDQTGVLFNDPLFLFVFLPITLGLAIVLRRIAGARPVLGLLVLASVMFYGWWNPLYVPLLAIVATITFLIARRISAARRAQDPVRTKAYLVGGIVFCLSVLAYFKYTDFAIATVNVALGEDIPYQNILLPLGISFFTFQKIAYLVDASRGEVEKHDFLEFCFFVMFFPQLIAGPIVHHHEIFSQTHTPHAFAPRLENLMIGLTIFLIGLFKKVVIADRLAPVAAATFGAAATGEPLSFVDAWTGAGAYSLQLYFDFSGYSDMAIGAARMFGIRLPLNFESPYQATGIIDFWRRWHMTLSRFLRDYLYIPLGGSRHGSVRRYFNLMLTMTIGGLWHGASWNFVLWGFLHGVYLVINHAWRHVWTPIDAWWSRSLSRLVTFAAVIIAFVPFRAPTMEVTLSMYAGMVNLPRGAADRLGVLQHLGIRFEGRPLASADWEILAWAIGFIAVLWFVPNTQQFMAWFRPAFNHDRKHAQHFPPLLEGVLGRGLLRWRPRAAGAVLVGVMAAIAGLSLTRVSEFLYFDF